MEQYSILDINGCANALREEAATSFTEDYTENLDEFISIKQVVNIIEKNSLGHDEDGCIIINEIIFDDIFNEIREWIYGVGLAKLASKGLVECAWDNDLNAMTFWLNDAKKEIISPKPTEHNENNKRRNRKKP